MMTSIGNSANPIRHAVARAEALNAPDAARVPARGLGLIGLASAIGLLAFHSSSRLRNRLGQKSLSDLISP
jgi:hypothetical protein